MNGECYIVRETRTVAIWVEDGSYETLRNFVDSHLEEIDDTLDNDCNAEWEYLYHSFLRKEDCDFVA